MLGEPCGRVLPHADCNLGALVSGQLDLGDAGMIVLTTESK